MDTVAHRLQDCDRYADDRLELESDVKALVEVQVPNVKKREALWRSWGGSYVSIKGALRDNNPARLQAFFDFLDTSGLLHDTLYGSPSPAPD